MSFSVRFTVLAVTCTQTQTHMCLHIRIVSSNDELLVYLKEKISCIFMPCGLYASSRQFIFNYYSLINLRC